MRFRTDCEAGGDGGVDEFIELLEFDMFFFQADGFHTAADVNADEIGDDLIGDGHGSADGAAGACVDVGHDADGSAVGEGLIAKGDDLGDSVGFDVIGKDLCICIFSV